MRSYYTENTDKGLKITITDRSDDFVNFADDGDIPALLTVAGFLIFLLIIA